jgi:hypothetical protein
MVIMDQALTVQIITTQALIAQIRMTQAHMIQTITALALIAQIMTQAHTQALIVQAQAHMVVVVIIKKALHNALKAIIKIDYRIL